MVERIKILEMEVKVSFRKLFVLNACIPKLKKRITVTLAELFPGAIAQIH